VGNRSLLSGGGLGIVGSRNVDQAGEVFTRQAAELCAYNRMPVVSGGARGVDQISMDAALEAGGVTIGILAENLLKKSVERKNRQAIANGRLLLLSPYHPNARFTVGTAMGRNKLIYAMSDFGLVVSAEHKKGGSWAGAEEELKRENALPVFVRTGRDVPQGNCKLLDLGATPWPDSINRKNFKQQLHDLAVKSRDNRPKMNQSLFDFQTPLKNAPIKDLPPATEVVKDKPKISKPKSVVETEVKIPECTGSIYLAVLPVILNKLDNPATVDELAETLDVNKTQLNAWLKKAVDDNKIIKLSKPVRYKKAESGIQV
jgi:predicted Rossmann fold nucleotide-binding protein DprA/Smf involved in DNA uptake